MAHCDISVMLSVLSVLVALCLTILPVADSLLEMNGCNEDWHNFSDHCFKIVLTEMTADDAKSHCESLNSNLASVWSEQEKEFISSLWQFPRYNIGFLWIGLRGSGVDVWKYDDKSSLQTKLSASARWSLLDDVSGVPSSTTNKCVALRPSGSLAFLDCPMTASAFVCKKALPKVYATARFENHTTTPTTGQPLNREQLFERMFPPRLSVLPDDSFTLATTDVTTEVGCAYHCFSVETCRVFQVRCLTHSKCSSFQCSLYSDSVHI